MTDIETMLVQQYGPLLTTPQLAAILGRSEGGLRYTVHTSSPLGTTLQRASVRIGRHVRYRTGDIARLLMMGEMAGAEQDQS